MKHIHNRGSPFASLSADIKIIVKKWMNAARDLEKRPISSSGRKWLSYDDDNDDHRRSPWTY